MEFEFELFISEETGEKMVFISYFSNYYPDIVKTVNANVIDY